MSRFGPYAELMRLHKPAGTFFFLWPFVWGLTMAASHAKLPYMTYATLLSECAFAAFIIRSSACTVNDIFDRKYDAAVERTKNRPLASGRVTVLSASVFLLFQFAAGYVAFVRYNKSAYQTAMLQMLPLCVIYPFMKRVTHWPQAWLGIAINFGFVVAWLLVDETHAYSRNSETITAMLGATWCWTMVYDTVYGCQDRKDDVKIGVKSTAVLFGEYVYAAVICFAICFVALLCYAGVVNKSGLPYFVISVGGGALDLIWQLTNLDVDSSPSCWNMFTHNAYVLGPLVAGGLFADYLRVMLYSI